MITYAIIFIHIDWKYFLILLFIFISIHFSVFAESNKSKQNKNEKMESNFTEELNSDDELVTIDVTHEVVSDFVWRGQSFSGDYISRRDNLPYKSFAEAYTYVPVARISHKNGFFFEMEANIALKGRGDRDSDQRIQAYPGGNPIDLNKWANQIVNPQNYETIFYDPTNALYAESCNTSLPNDPFLNPCSINPIQIKPFAEKNGLARTDGLFTTFAYEMETRRLGTFTVGSWWYFKKDRSSKNTWNEYFIWWELPWMQGILNPTLQSFKQTSANTQAGYSSQYTSLSFGHHFLKDKDISVELTTNIGYVWVNNPESQKSGLNDITSTIKFIWNQYFLSLNHAHRPDINLYDNDKIYFRNSESNPQVLNFSERDGATADPSKLYGVSNELVDRVINQFDASDLIQDFAKNKLQSQMIPRNLFWIGLGMNQTF